MDFDSLPPEEKKAFVNNVFRTIEKQDRKILALYMWLALTAFVGFMALWLFAGDKIINEWNH